MTYKTLFFSDEAWFHLFGVVNYQNDGTWSMYNLHDIVAVPLCPIKIGICVATS
jgi:hypothetical protein